ncbi:MAG: ATP-binding protein [Bacteroidales bacterium]
MRSLKVFLAALVIGAVLPGLLFGLGTSIWLAREIRLSTEQDARLIAEQAAAAVGENVRLVTAAMRVLARSPALAREDLHDAYLYATALAEDLQQHIGLATADGEQLFNTRRPYGTPLPRRASASSYKRALESGLPSVSDVVVGALTQKPLITIDVPAVTPNGMRVLGTSTDLSTIGSVLERTPLRPGWKAAIVDGEGRFIARSLDAEKYAGKPAVPEVMAIAKSNQQNGFFRNHSYEGEDLYSVFAKVPGTNWTVVIGTPEPNFLAPVRGPLLMLAVAGGIAVVLTLLAAMVLGRRLDAAARRLTDDAHAIAAGRPLQQPSQSIAEFVEVENAFHHAACASREREAELALAREAAEQSVAAKNRLLAAASHDLRQPLHATGLCVEMMRQVPFDAALAKYVSVLERTHAAMSALITTLFDIAKMDADGVTPCYGRVSLPDLLARVVVECRPAAEEKGVALRLHPGPALAVVTDDEMVVRILRNLVHNAIRYTEAGGILVDCRRRADALWIEVWDTGIGIPADQLGLIWEEFYQVSGRGRTKGSGLGLSIVWRLAKVLGYRVEARSVVGRGSCFRLVLPNHALETAAASGQPDAVEAVAV